MSLQVTATKHRYFAAQHPCGHKTAARPASGLHGSPDAGNPPRRSVTSLAPIADENPRVLPGVVGFELGVLTIEPESMEFGLVSEVVVEQLLQEVRAAEIVHIDETLVPSGCSDVAVGGGDCAHSRIGERAKGQLVALIGEAFLVGW